MGGYERPNRASSTVPKPSSRAASASSTDAQSPARVTLPNDLTGSLKYLDDAQLQMLLQAVIVEFNRRKQAPKNKTATTKSSKGQPAASRDKKLERSTRSRKEEQTLSGHRSGRASSLRPSRARSESPSPW